MFSSQKIFQTTAPPSTGGGGITPSYSIVNGNCFDMTLIPESSDSYTLSQLGTALTGTWGTSVSDRYMSSNWITILMNGQGRTCLGTGGGSFTSTNYQLNFDVDGNGSFSFSTYDDAFQPGTPHEAGLFWSRTASSGGTLYTLGGSNNTSNVGGSNQNSTVRGWKRSSSNAFYNNARIFLCGNTTAGHAVFQYQLFNGATDTNQSGKVVRILHQYTNTTSSNRWISFQRGGDVDFSSYSTNNVRSSNQLTYSYARYGSPQRTLGVYLPANGTDGISGTPTRNTVIATSFTLYNPPVLATGSSRSNGLQDTSIYMAADWGQVAPGETVYACGYYVVGLGVTDMQEQIL